MSMFENIEDVLDMITPAPLLGRLEEGEDPSRSAIEDPSSPEAAMLGALLLGSKGKKAIEGVLDAPVGKAKKLKRIGMRDIPTTGTELPPEIPDEIKRLAGIEPKVKPSASASAPKSVFQKLASDGPKTRKSVAEMRGPVNESGLAGKVDEFTKGQKFKKLAGDKVAKEATEEVAEKGAKKGMKFMPKTVKGKLGGALALYFLYNQFFGDKKKKPVEIIKKKSNVKPKATTPKVDPRMEAFKKFSEDLDRELEAMEI